MSTLLLSQRSQDPVVESGTTLFALGLWLRLVFIGASVFIAALVSLADKSTHVGGALTLALVGGVLVTVAALRVRSALHEDDAPARARHSVHLNS